MIINYADLRLVVINYATSLESMGLSVATQFLEKVLWIANEALQTKGQDLRIEPTWQATFVIPADLLQSQMENRHVYFLADMVLDLFEENGKLEVRFEGESLALLKFPVNA